MFPVLSFSPGLQPAWSRMPSDCCCDSWLVTLIYLSLSLSLSLSLPLQTGLGDPYRCTPSPCICGALSGKARVAGKMRRHPRDEEHAIKAAGQTQPRGRAQSSTLAESKPGLRTVRQTKGVPRKGVGASVNGRIRTCKESRAKRDQTNVYLRPPFLGSPLAPSRLSI